MRVPSLIEPYGIMLLAYASACAPAPEPSREPHLPTIEALRPKLDSIEGRIGFQSVSLAARIDSLERRNVRGEPQTSVRESDTDSTRTTESEAVGTPAVQEGVIVGIVMDVETGQPLEAAQVAIRDVMIGDLSDQSGRFEIPGVPLGEYELRAAMVGYAPVGLRIRVDRAQGVVARFLLRPHAWVDCEFISVRRVRATVRDVVTGLAPATATALRVSNGRERWWALGNADGEGDSLDLVVQVGTGPLSVEVAAEGYALWRGTAVMPQSEGCVPGGSATLDVWLLPTEDHSWRREEGAEEPGRPNRDCLTWNCC